MSARETILDLERRQNDASQEQFQSDLWRAGINIRASKLELIEFSADLRNKSMMLPEHALTGLRRCE